MISTLTALLTLTSTSAVVAGFTAGMAAMCPRLRHATREATHARWLSEHDTLTRLPNRAAAMNHFGRQSAAGRPCALAILDLDDFKMVNDTWGHQVGDALLVAVADQLTTACERIGAHAFRLGGDEFVLLLSAVDLRDVLDQTAAVVTQVGAAVPSTTEAPRTAAIRASASAGLATPDTGDTFADLLRKADIALYHAKRHHAEFRLYTAGMLEPASHRHKAAARDPHVLGARVTRAKDESYTSASPNRSSANASRALSGWLLHAAGCFPSESWGRHRGQGSRAEGS